MNMTVIFSAVTLEIKSGIYKTFHKPNENIKYITIGSNHPKSENSLF